MRIARLKSSHWLLLFQYNFVTEQKDRTGPTVSTDGNGIQVDHFCKRLVEAALTGHYQKLRLSGYSRQPLTRLYDIT